MGHYDHVSTDAHVLVSALSRLDLAAPAALAAAQTKADELVSLSSLPTATPAEITAAVAAAKGNPATNSAVQSAVTAFILSSPGALRSALYAEAEAKAARVLSDGLRASADELLAALSTVVSKAAAALSDYRDMFGDTAPAASQAGSVLALGSRASATFAAAIQAMASLDDVSQVLAVAADPVLGMSLPQSGRIFADPSTALPLSAAAWDAVLTGTLSLPPTREDLADRVMTYAHADREAAREAADRETLRRRLGPGPALQDALEARTAPTSVVVPT